MPKIIAHVHAYVGHGREAGAETTLANLLETLVEVGWEAEVILSQGNHNYTHNRVRVISETVLGINFMHYAKQADVLITHLECSERTAFIGRPLGIPVVQVIHNTLWQTEGYLREGCDLAVYNSEWVAEWHKDPTARLTRLPQKATPEMGQRVVFKAPSAPTWPHVVIHPQIDPKLYKTRAGSREYITLINLFENKGPDVFWELARRFPNEKFLAVKGGYGHQVIPDEIPENVTVMENVADPRAIYRLTKILLMPSTYESFGRVAIEAAASSIPTIATPTPGLSEALGPDTPYCDRDSVDDWELELTVLLGNEIAYKAACKMARSRSAYWDARRPQESSEFIAAINSFLR